MYRCNHLDHPFFSFSCSSSCLFFFVQLIIPTLDSVRFEKLLNISYNVEKSSLLVGGPGTAKTSVIMQFMGKVGSMERLWEESVEIRVE